MACFRLILPCLTNSAVRLRFFVYFVVETAFGTLGASGLTYFRLILPCLALDARYLARFRLISTFPAFDAPFLACSRILPCLTNGAVRLRFFVVEMSFGTLSASGLTYFRLVLPCLTLDACCSACFRLILPCLTNGAVRLRFFVYFVVEPAFGTLGASGLAYFRLILPCLTLDARCSACFPLILPVIALYTVR